MDASISHQWHLLEYIIVQKRYRWDARTLRSSNYWTVYAFVRAKMRLLAARKRTAEKLAMCLDVSKLHGQNKRQALQTRTKTC